MVESDDLDGHLVREAAAKSLVDHIFFEADAQSSHERGQALARIAITATVALLLLLHTATTATPLSGRSELNLLVGIGYAVFSVPYYRWIIRQPRCCRWRRYLVIALDLGVTAYFTFAFGLAGLGFYAGFLWVIIGNGLRYGPHYLAVAAALGTAFFLLATLGNGSLSSQPGIVMGLLLGLLLMPRFFLAMIHRLGDANRLLAKKKQEAEYQATHDALTGLPNRTLLEGILARELAAAKRDGLRLAVAFIDLDSFKSINDNFGHHAGDELLRQFAACLQGRVRGSDTVARLGGDEFIVLLHNCGDPGTVAAVVGQLFACSGRYYRIGHQETYVTWSCGVAVYPHDGNSGSALIKHADTAMYQAKSAGSGQFRLYDVAMSAEVAEQLELRESLRRGIEQRQFEVHYQPQVSLPGERIENVEALVRWRHPLRGLLYPGDFIDAAEQTGLIVDIGYLVLEQAVADARCWREQGLGEIRVHVNISPHQLTQPGFVDRVRRMCETHRCPPASLGLEITENTLISDLDATSDVLARLRGDGFIISMDDFGTGFSSLGYLKSLPIDRLKIDRSFVRDIPGDAYDCTLIEATLMIGRQLGLGLIAEGVETPEQRAWLVQRGCTQMQGFLFAPALPAARLEARLKKSG